MVWEAGLELRIGRAFRLGRSSRPLTRPSSLLNDNRQMLRGRERNREDSYNMHETQLLKTKESRSVFLDWRVEETRRGTQTKITGSATQRRAVKREGRAVTSEGGRERKQIGSNALYSLGGESR